MTYVNGQPLPNHLPLQQKKKNQPLKLDNMNRRESLKILASLPFMAMGQQALASENKNGAAQAAPSEGKAKDVVIILADGMGIPQWQAAAVYANGNLNVLRMGNMGLTTTNPTDVFCGDAPSHSTALATGVNSKKGAVSVDPSGKPTTTIMELAKKAGLAAGIVSANSLFEGSVVPFAGHAASRMQTEALSASMVDTGFDVMIGAGKSFFTNKISGLGPGAGRPGAGGPGQGTQGQGRPEANQQGQAPQGQGGPGTGGGQPQMKLEPRSDGRDLLSELRQKGYTVTESAEEAFKVKSGKLLALTSDLQQPNLQNGRDENLFPDSVTAALNILSADSRKGFVLVAGDMYVDRASHNGKTELLCQEAMNLDKAIGRALSFADADKQTLVLVVGSPEASGMSLVDGNEADGTVEPNWSMPGMARHSGIMVPYFAYGAGASAFNGMKRNTDFFPMLKDMLSLA